MGTFTSAERLVQLLKPVYGRFAGKPDLEILVELARKMGAANFDYTGPEQVFDEIASLVAPYKGISYGRLQEKGVNWPCPDENDPGRPILYEGGFPAGKAKLFPAAKPSAVKGERPMFLIPSVVKFHSGSFSSWSPSLMEVCPEAIAEMNSLDMAALGVAEGDSVRISGSAGSSIVVKATASYRAMAGSIIVPYHFGSVRLNSLTDWGNGPLTVKVEKSA
jgi:predicted molibdopterin-dependent oxidoreductase YjgC